MKYVKTLQLWGDNGTGIQEAIRNGQLKLQVGQWVLCGEGKKSRYVSHSKVSINVVHWQGSAKATNDLFKRRVAMLHNMKGKK